GGEDFQIGAVGADASDAAAHGDRAAILAAGQRRAVVADGDVDPAVQAHADAVGRVVAATLVDHVAGQPSDEDFGLSGDALAAVAVDAEKRRMQDPERAVLVDQAAWMVHLGEHGNFIDLAVAVLVDAAQHFAAARRAADRPLLVDGDEQLTRRRRRQRDGIVHLGRRGEERHVKAGRRLNDGAERLLIDGLTGGPAEWSPTGEAATDLRRKAERAGDEALALAGK